MTDPVVLTALAGLTITGVLATFYGFEIAAPLLRLAGAIAGIVAGLVLGVGVVPTVVGDVMTVEVLLGVAVLLVVVGAVVGARFVPALKRLAIGAMAFVATTVAALLVLTGERVLTTVFDAVSATALRDPVGLVETIATDPVFQSTDVQQGVAIAVVCGLVGGALGLRYYTDIIALAMAVAGAALLAVAIPLWIDVAGDGFAVDPDGLAFSLRWFVATLVGGLLFQLGRHFSALDPRTGDHLVSR